MRTDYETLAVSLIEPHILRIMLNRPEAANAFNTQMSRELMEIFEAFQLDLYDLRAIIVTGAGEKAFCAGGDLKERKGMTDAQWQAQHAVFERMARAILACPIPVIAAVNRAAFAGGCEIAALCDFIYASDNARFALTEVTLGIMPGAGGTQTLSRAIGERRAKELILTGTPFSAVDAAQWGFVNKVLPQAELLDAALTPSRRSRAGCKGRSPMVSLSRSKPISAWCRPKTGAKAFSRSTKSGNQISAAYNALPQRKKSLAAN